MPRHKRGDLVVIEFLDHCTTDGGTAPVITCRAVGWVVEESPRHIMVECWQVTHPIELNETNRKTFTIVKEKRSTRIRKVTE